MVPPEPPTPRSARAFVSYSTADKLVAASVRDFLESYGIQCFVAHDDLQVSEEWKEVILEELLKCDIFVPILSASFRASDWCAQEVGVISGRRGVAIVPLSVDGTTPFGFISNIQGKPIPGSGPTADLVIVPLLRRFPRLLFPGLIEKVRTASSFREAEAALLPLVPHFGVLTDAELVSLVEACISNGQVWSATRCRATYLPKLIAAARSRVVPERLEVLEYQVANDAWFPRGQ
jgi:hypothetical protein